jgi:hypothetical protein
MARLGELSYGGVVLPLARLGELSYGGVVPPPARLGESSYLDSESQATSCTARDLADASG